MKRNILFATLLALLLTGCSTSQTLMTHVAHLENQGDMELSGGATLYNQAKTDLSLTAAATDHWALQVSTSFLPGRLLGRYYPANDLLQMQGLPLEPRSVFFSLRPAVGYFSNPTEHLMIGLYAGIDIGRQRQTMDYYNSYSICLGQPGYGTGWDVHAYEYFAAFGQVDLSWSPRPWLQVAGRLRLGWCDAFGYRGQGFVDTDGGTYCWHDQEEGFSPRARQQMIVDPMLQVSLGAKALKASLSLSFDRTFCDQDEGPILGLGVSYRFNPLKR